MDDAPTMMMGPSQFEPHHAEPEEPGRSKLMVFLVVVILLLACATTGLAVALLMGRDSDEEAQTPTTLVTTSTTIVQREGGSAGGSTGGSSGEDGSTDGSDSDGGEDGGTDEPAAPCSGDALLATIGGSVDGHPVVVTDYSCTSSGAHAWALFTPTEAGLDPLYAYFRDVGGGWETLDYGTSISCTGAGISADECAELP